MIKIKLTLLESITNIYNLIPYEFSDDEISKIKEIFPKVYSKKRYSLYNPNNLLSESCQWYNDKLYVSFGYTIEVMIRRNSISIYYYKLKYNRDDPIKYIPNQYGVCNTTLEWKTYDDLRSIKENILISDN